MTNETNDAFNYPKARTATDGAGASCQTTMVRVSTVWGLIRRDCTVVREVEVGTEKTRATPAPPADPVVWPTFDQLLELLTGPDAGQHRGEFFDHIGLVERPGSDFNININEQEGN